MADNYAKELEHSKSGVRLREHQIVGLRKILYWHDVAKHGGIVADEMGLGKTCQAIGTIVCLINANKTGHHIVICPLSVLEHWHAEMNRFGLGKLKIVRYVGNADARKELREKMLISSSWNVLLTTYEMIICEEKELYKTQSRMHCMPWSSLFIDEAHRLKSHKSVIHQIVRKMHAEFIVLLTGTPLQNNISELYSLLSLIDEKNFSLLEEEQFIAKYRNANDEKVAAELQQLLSNYMFRRTKKMLRINIPDRSELVIYHGITELQKKLYRAILGRNYEYFEHIDDKKAQSGNKQSLLNVLMELRKCVAHPYLFDGIEPEPFKEGDHLYEASGKFFLLDCLLKFLVKKGHRVLIFSQMTRVLDIAQDYLIYKGYNYERLDGSVRAEERFAAVNRFQDDPETFCFLLSTRAGGLGLNLTAADTVIFLDSDFNPQNDIQAAARCHRIGQTKPVKIIRLIARYTVEDMIQCRAKRKLQMTYQILGSNDDAKKDLTATEISDLIVKGLNRLNDEETAFEALDMKAVEKLVGKTDVNGRWILDEGEQSHQELEPKKEEGTEVDNMYIFEGHDYKQDVVVLQNILNKAKTIIQTARTVRGAPPHAVVEGRKRKPLSQEEIDERQRKRQETLRQKEILRKALAEKKRAERYAKKKIIWSKNNYSSTSLPLPHDLEFVDVDSDINFGPHFVYGSITEPQKAPDDESDHAVIVHVVDDSGCFGRGGVFDALRNKSQEVVDAYEFAGRMDDLHIGDAHFVKNIAEQLPITPLRQGARFRDDNGNEQPEQSTTATALSKGERKKWCISVVFLVAQRYRARDVINQDVLAECFQRLALYAIRFSARSVHMPRIGYNMRNISWYVIERLISRILVAKGIHTYIYYCNRRTNTITTGNLTSDMNTNKRRGDTQTGTPCKRENTGNPDSGDETDDFEEEEEEEMEEEEESESGGN